MRADVNDADLGIQGLERRRHIVELCTWYTDAYKGYEYQKAPEWANVSDEELARLKGELGWHVFARAALA